MKIFNVILGIAFFGGVVAVPAGGYLAWGPVSYNNASAHFTLACRMGAMRWMPQNDSTQLLAQDCGCFGSEIVKRLSPSDRIKEAGKLRDFMVRVTIDETLKDSSYDALLASPEYASMREGALADPLLFDWVAFACLESTNA